MVRIVVLCKNEGGHRDAFLNDCSEHAFSSSCISIIILAIILSCDRTYFTYNTYFTMYGKIGKVGIADNIHSKIYNNNFR